MTKIINEDSSLFDENGMKSEEYFIPLDENMMDYLNCESKNLKSLTEQYDFQDSKVIGKRKKSNLIYLEDNVNHDVLAVKLEDAINYEIDHYMSNL